MIPPHGRVLVALSGGSDSVALLHVLRALESRGGWTVAGVAHLNHGLRAAAVEDETFCREIARAVGGSRFDRRSVDVRDLARQLRTSIEDAGRRARYAFFEEAASELGAIRDCDRPYARRSGRDVSASHDPWRRTARAVRDPAEKSAG